MNHHIYHRIYLRCFLKNYCYQAFVIVSCFLSLQANAGEKIAQTLAVSDNAIVYIDITRGVVKVSGWDKNEVSIQGELDDSVKELIFKNIQQKTLIKAVNKGQKQWGDSSVLKVFMPAHAQLYFKGIDTTFTLSALKKSIKGKSISGDLLADELSGDIALSSMSGGVKVVNSRGEIQLESVSGDIVLAGSYEDVHARTMSGNITMHIDEADNVRAKTVSGELLAIGNVKKNADINLNSVSGDIVYQATDELDAQCEVSSQFGGEITNKFTLDQVQQSRMNKKMLKFVTGGGSGSIIMHTISGNVMIDKTLADKSSTDKKVTDQGMQP